jgi:hypothetical protein
VSSIDRPVQGDVVLVAEARVRPALDERARCSHHHVAALDGHVDVVELDAGQVEAQGDGGPVTTAWLLMVVIDADDDRTRHP